MYLIFSNCVIDIHSWVRWKPFLGVNLPKKSKTTLIIHAIHSMSNQMPTTHMINWPGVLSPYWGGTSWRWGESIYLDRMSRGLILKYFFHAVRSPHLSNVGKGIIFGLGEPLVASCSILDWACHKPNLEYCNLKLTVACAMNASGAAGIIAEMYGDDDDDEAIN